MSAAPTSTELVAELSHLRQEMALISGRLVRMELLLYNKVLNVPVPSVGASATTRTADDEKVGDDAPLGLFAMEAATAPTSASGSPAAKPGIVGRMAVRRMGVGAAVVGGRKGTAATRERGVVGAAE